MPKTSKDWKTATDLPESERYGLYLASREWALLKKKVKKRSGGMCERCKVNPSSAVHHLTYERKYREELDDLQDTCQACHEFTHGNSDFDPAAATDRPATITGVFETSSRIFIFFQLDDIKSIYPEKEVFTSFWSWEAEKYIRLLLGPDYPNGMHHQRHLPAQWLIGRKYRVRTGFPENGADTQIIQAKIDDGRPRSVSGDQVTDVFCLKVNAFIDAL